jgi:heptosyltransferase-1
MRIVIVVPDCPDEIVPIFPALTDAFRAQPGLAFTVLTGDAAAPWAALHPAVDQVVTFPLERLVEPWWKARGRRARRDWKRLLGEHEALASAETVIDPLGGEVAIETLRRLPGRSVGMVRSTGQPALKGRQVYDSPYPIPAELHRVQAIRMLFAAHLDYSLHDLDPDYGLGIEAEPIVTDLLFDPRGLPFDEAGNALLRRRFAETGVTLDDLSAQPPEDETDYRRRLTQSRYVLTGTNLTGWLAAALGIPGVCVCEDGQARHDGVITTRHAAQKLINVDTPPMNQPEIVVESIIQVITGGEAPIELPEKAPAEDGTPVVGANSLRRLDH